MSPTPPEDPLSRTLAAWRLAPRRNPRFRAAVLDRLGAERRESRWTDYVRVHGALVTGAVAVALVLGALTGRGQARARLEADRAAIATAYVEALDARAMNREP